MILFSLSLCGPNISLQRLKRRSSSKEPQKKPHMVDGAFDTIFDTIFEETL